MITRRRLPLVGALALVLATNLWAGEGFRVIHVNDLAALMAQHTENLFIYDANPPSTREREGIIPGAHLLPSLDYAVDDELPAKKDAKLVFYCANSH
jgi:rhodanese-related sulfurtransferase